MKKIIIKIITIIIAFAAGVVFTSYLYNKGNLDMTAHMAEATLPILYYEHDGKYVNPSYGHTSEMDASCMRNAIMPLDNERILHIALEKYNAEIEKVSYEVRSSDMERLIQNGEINDLEETGQYLKATVKIKDLLEDSEEYLLIFHVQTENFEDVQYISRITNASHALVNDCTGFAFDFHNATLDPNNEYPITQYLETNLGRKETSLGHADINSRYKTIIWDGMKVEESKEPTINYLELDNDVISLEMDYRVTFQNENGENEEYQVKDYFRVKQTNIRMYLLDYKRTAERIFYSDSPVFTETSLNLGIQWDEIPYKSNEEGSVVNFVVSDELWSYDVGQNKLSKVFSFKNGNDKRGLHDEFEIQLVNMEDSGSMDFIVKGYMNRGIHEGESGIAVMRYDSLTNTTEELLFIESKECADVIAQTVGELTYISYDDKMYVSLSGDIYAIDLNIKSVETLTEDLKSGDYLISRAGDMIAWQHGTDRFSSSQITTMDMKTGVRHTYNAKSGEYLRALGFSGDDFIYGVCSEADVAEDFAGNTLFPMHRVEIVDSKGDLIRDFDYLSKNKYVVSATMENNRINLQCISKNDDGSYVEALAETITSSEEEQASSIQLSEVKHDVKKVEQIFKHKAEAKGKRKLITPKQVIFEENRNLAFEEEESVAFHAYGRGDMLGVHGEIRNAIVQAYDKMGVVTDHKGQVVWERGNRKTRSVLELANGTEGLEANTSLEAGLRILLEQEGVYNDVAALLENGKSPYQILKQYSQKQPENFTGCNLSSVLYYVSEGNYVLAMTDANSAELIVGYDAQNIYVLNPLTGQMHKEGQKDAAAKYEACGNVFFSFLK